MFNKDIIIELLNERGWTPYRLCQESKMAQSTLSDILTGNIMSITFYKYFRLIAKQFSTKK